MTVKPFTTARIKHWARGFLSRFINRKIPVRWIKADSRSWLSRQLQAGSIRPANTVFSARIEKLAQATNKLGPQPLWSGYAGAKSAETTRNPDGVRTDAAMGNLYTDLVRKLQPRIIVEFGTAFGVSGMYFLAGLESNRRGRLLTFEPNEIWRRTAVRNLSQIGDRFTSVAGTFEEKIDAALPRDLGIDLAFIDAIHTREFVLPQLEKVIARSSDGALIILDDINFSDGMRSCWTEVSADGRVLSSVALGDRVGILELGRLPS